MTTEADLSVADRLAQVLDHLGIERAHFAASMLADVASFAACPERIASLTLVCPPRLDPSALGALGARLQIIAGEQGRPAAMVRDAVTTLPEATVVWLSGYFSPPWADVVADCTADVETALLNILARDQLQKDRAVQGSVQGAVAGITYHSQGEGPPLVLLPLSLASSQWDPCCRDSARGVARSCLAALSWVFWPAPVASLGIIDVMRKAGLFKKYGLDVDLVYIQGSPILTAAMVSRQVPLSFPSAALPLSPPR
jgi:hypothetical protein